MLWFPAKIRTWQGDWESVGRLQTDLTDKTGFLVEGVLQSARTYLAALQDARKAYEQAKTEMAVGKHQLGRERLRMMSGNGEGDVLRLFECEQELVPLQDEYLSKAIELMTLLQGEARNVAMGQGLLKYLEVLKRHFLRNTILHEQAVERLKVLQSWIEMSQDEVQRSQRLKIASNRLLGLVQAWGLLGRVLCNPASAILSAILHLIDKVSSQSNRDPLLEAIIYLHIAVEEPFPPQLASFVHLAQKSKLTLLYILP